MNLLVSEVPHSFIALCAFLFGATWGSFFNVAIYRWPLGLSVVKPDSHCPYCSARVPLHLNIPILGYFILRGKTACCGQPLSPRYPIVETLGALLCVAVAERFIAGADPNESLLKASLIGLCYFAFAGGLLVATFVDLEHMEIPDEVSLPGAALGLATAALRDPPGAEAAALGAGGAFLVVQVLFVWCYELLLGRRGMGEGDSKLLLMIGAFIGWQGATFSLFAGAAQGLIVAAYGLLTGKRFEPRQPEPDEDLETGGASVDGVPAAERVAPPAPSDPPPSWIGHFKLPFGPFLALAALEYLFFGDVVVDAWLRLMDRGLASFGG